MLRRKTTDTTVPISQLPPPAKTPGALQTRRAPAALRAAVPLLQLTPFVFICAAFHLEQPAFAGSAAPARTCGAGRFPPPRSNPRRAVPSGDWPALVSGSRPPIGCWRRAAERWLAGAGCGGVAVALAPGSGGRARVRGAGPCPAAGRCAPPPPCCATGRAC